MKSRSIISRNITNAVFKAFVIVVSLIAVVPLILILIYLFQKGIGQINLNFFLSGSKPTGEIGGGILNALVGSVLLISIAALIAVPFGILTGVYLAENKTKKLASFVRWAVELLQGVPSIVLGLAGYAWFVLPVAQLSGSRVTFSILAGSLTLSIMMLPTIIKSTEETVLLVPNTLKEASIALGVPYYKTMLFVILPASLSGIMTGVLLGVSRIAGETAPLLFTSFGNPFMNVNVMKPMNSLPLVIFNYASSPYKEWHSIAWGASFILIIMILILNITAKIISGKWKIKY